MTHPTAQLCDLLELEQLDQLLFRSHPAPSQLPRVYGGQVLAQALNAATRTVPEERHIHSLQAYFLRPGDTSRAIIYDVDPIRDGGSFTTRRVVAKQNGKAIFSAGLSFQKIEKGFEHQLPMPEVPAPESLLDDREIMAQLQQSNATLEVPPSEDYYGAFEIRTNGPLPMLTEQGAAPQQGFWMKTRNPMPDQRRMHEALLAFASDSRLMGSALIPHGVKFNHPDLQAASLDHGMWFHAPFRVDQWLYYQMEGPVASRGRGLNYGHFFDLDGRLVASTVQEGLMRAL